MSDTIRARFNPLIRPYLVVYVGGVMAVTIFLLPLALIWFLGVGQWWARHYFEKLECTLDATSLRYRKGILVTVEKTIPLENLQDVTFIEGPVLRRFNLSVLKFETAGQSAGQAHDMQLVGIIDAQAFRAEILARRAALRRGHAPGAGAPLVQPGATLMPGPVPTAADAAAQLEVLARIDARLAEIAELLRRERKA